MKKQEGRYREKRIEITQKTVKAAFVLKTGGENIQRRSTWKESPNFRAETRPGKKPNRGVLRDDCISLLVKQRLDFMVHAMHLTRPCTEYSRYMIQAVKNYKERQGNWINILYDCLVGAMKRAHEAIRDGKGIALEIGPHLRIILHH